MLINLRLWWTALPAHLPFPEGFDSRRADQAARAPAVHRALAEDLGVSRNTVMLAYEQLAAEGYLVNRDRAAASVARRFRPWWRRRASKAGTAPQALGLRRRLDGKLGTTSFSPSWHPPRLSLQQAHGGRVSTRASGAACCRRARKSSQASLGYASPAGTLRCREALAEHLAARAGCPATQGRS
jgi:GntR family transcriptional regulator/MocR family aminotransferase